MCQKPDKKCSIDWGLEQRQLNYFSVVLYICAVILLFRFGWLVLDAIFGVGTQSKSDLDQLGDMISLLGIVITVALVVFTIGGYSYVKYKLINDEKVQNEIAKRMVENIKGNKEVQNEISNRMVENIKGNEEVQKALTGHIAEQTGNKFEDMQKDIDTHITDIKRLKADVKKLKSKDQNVEKNNKSGEGYKKNE
jgi:hypothetical protein